MKKISTKFIKILMLISMIFSSLQTPIYVLADELNNNTQPLSVTPEKGDMKLGEDGEIIKEGSVTVTAGDENLTEEGNIQVTKTVSEVEGEEGKYKVDFLIKGKNFVTETSTTKDSYTVFVLDASGSMNGTPWEKAKEAAISFSEKFVSAGSNNYLALVTFNSNGYQKRGFQNAVFTTNNLGNTSKGTNYNAGLTSAYNYLNALSSEIKENASLNIIFISDGEPNGESYSTTLSNIKSMGTNIYTFAYNLDPIEDANAYNRLKAISTDNNVTSIESNNIDSILESFVSKVTVPTLAGTNATLTDGIGGQFKIITENNEEISGYGISYESSNIAEITEEGTLLTFYIQINKDAPTGWHQTNASFKLEYTDSEENQQTITCNEDPYVYWVQAEYDYIVNYYKDSITENNLLATETRQAPVGTIINETNVDKNKYLSTAGISYEYQNLTPESITITNDGQTKIINVLYIKVYGDLTVKHVDTVGNDLITPVTTTKEVGTNYTTSAATIYGYTLTEIPNNAEGTYTKEPITVTYVYSKNEGTVENNEVVKTQTNTIIGANSTFKYTLTYTGTVKDYIGSATITLTDKLPYEVSSIKFDEGCSFDETTRILTCTKTVELNENNQKVDASFNVEVTYKNLTGTTNLEVLNKVESTLTFGQTDVKDESEVTDTVKSGSVTAIYVDENNNELSDSVTTSGLVDTEYETNEKTIYGYTLKEVIGSETGKYKTEEITVTYVYSKNEGTVENNEVTKTGPENVTSVNGVFNYTLTYKATIKDYVGKATVTLKDILPYEIDEELSTFEGCTYENKTITCTKEINIDETNKDINLEYNLSLVFKNIDSEKITNIVESTLKYGNNEETDKDETETIVSKGKVTAIYVDEDNNELSDSVTTSGLVDTEYETNEKTIYGYTLKEVIGSETGKYTTEEITVTYVYSKNNGTVENNEVVKTQTNTIIGANSTFKYTLTYTGTVKDYIGSATITLTDKLPYEVSSIKFDEGCSFDETTRILTCTKTVELNENNQKVDASFNVEVTYKNLTGTTNLEVLNKVESTLTFGQTDVKDESEVTDTVKSGSVTAIYVDENNNELSDSVTTSGLVDTEYETNEKTIYGYTLKEVIGSETGKYKTEEITVTYVYSKNEGTVENNEVTKTGPENVTSVNGVFNYTLTYKAIIKDYVGKATVTLKDILPYEIDEELSTFEGCTYENKTITCTKEINIDETNKDINLEYNLSLVFKNIDSEKITNIVESTLKYGKNEETDKDETETEVFKGQVIATYKNEQGETLNKNITKEDLAGNDYETKALEFLGYTLIETPENQKGKYIANETIYVNYVYSKNVGTSEEMLEKQGTEKVDNINAPFAYKITYNLEVFDYVGEVKIILTDYLPYEIDKEKSILGTTCQYADGKLICEYLKTIRTEEDSKIKIEENVVLYYKNIDSNQVTNRVEAVVVYGEEEIVDSDEWTTEISSGTLIVKYVNEDGLTLAPTIVTTKLIGTDYTTKAEIFDKYYLKEVIGETTGFYKEEDTEVTYVYSLIPLPPQTGVENNSMNYLGLLIYVAIVLILKKKYI